MPHSPPHPHRLSSSSPSETQSPGGAVRSFKAGIEGVRGILQGWVPRALGIPPGVASGCLYALPQTHFIYLPALLFKLKWWKMDGCCVLDMRVVCVVSTSVPTLVPRVALRQLCTSNIGKWISIQIVVLSHKNENILVWVYFSPSLPHTHTHIRTHFYFDRSFSVCKSRSCIHSEKIIKQDSEIKDGIVCLLPDRVFIYHQEHTACVCICMCVI